LLTVPAPFELSGEHIAVALNGARALFTTRRGGCSTGPYASLNLGQLTGDDPAAVSENRARLERAHGVALAYGHQVHGATVRRRERGQGTAVPEPADGLLTALPGVAPMVLSADCLTIAIAARGATGVLHAGWRGLAAGVIAAGVAELRALAGEREIEAAIGPGAGGCCYEVGDELRERFAGYGPAVRHGRNLDLKAIASAQLVEAGVAAVHDVGLCTLCADTGLFFSHRRDRGITGRQAALAWLS
jgi:hypothetical protein